VLLGRVAQAIQARDEARLALRETHAILAGASFAGSQPRTTTAVGIEAPSDDDGLDGRLPTPSGSEAQEAVAAYLERLQTLESELSGQETLMRSLTAQLEERDDRIRALDRRLAGASPVASDEESTKRAMLELEERAARLSEELHNERSSRMAAQRRAEQLERSTEAAPDLTELSTRLRARDAELEAAEARAKSAARDVSSLRAVVQDASLTLEGLLSSATASGDPATAQRLGELLTQLARF
jgi:DNA repair exonuclease SbcCD ATPase subunit